MDEKFLKFQTKGFFSFGKLFLFSILLLFCFSCENGSVTSVINGSSTEKKVSGIVSVSSALQGATVKIYKITNGVVDGASISGAVAITGSDGKFSDLSVGTHTGGLLIEITPRTETKYVDPATQKTRTADFKLYAVMPSITSASNSVVVSPLTTIAYKKLASSITFDDASINTANSLVSNLFLGRGTTASVSTINILTNTPSDISSSTSASESDSAKKYGAAAAMISQTLYDQNIAMDTFLTSLAQEIISKGTFSDSTKLQLLNSLETILSDSTKNKSNMTYADSAVSDAIYHDGVITTGKAPTNVSNTKVTISDMIVKSGNSGTLSPSIVNAGDSPSYLWEVATISDTSSTSVDNLIILNSDQQTKINPTFSVKSGLITANVGYLKLTITRKDAVKVSCLAKISVVASDVTASRIEVYPSEIRTLGLNSSTASSLKTLQMNAKMYYSDGTNRTANSDVTWSVSNDNVSISTSGLLTAQKIGKSDVTAKYQTLTSTAVTIEVTDQALTLKSVSLVPSLDTSVAICKDNGTISGSNITVPAGCSVFVTAIGNLTSTVGNLSSSLDLTFNDSFSFETSNSGVANFSTNPKNKILTGDLDNNTSTSAVVGTSVITGKIGSFTSPLLTLKVDSPKITGITIAPENENLVTKDGNNLVLREEEYLTLKVYEQYSDNTRSDINFGYTIVSQNTGCVTIDSGNKVHAVKFSTIPTGGSCTTNIIGYVDSKSSSALSFKVLEAKLTALTIVIPSTGTTSTTYTAFPSNCSMKIGENKAFMALGTYSTGFTRDITSKTEWSTDSNSYAYFVSNVLRGVAQGSVVISAKAKDSEGNYINSISKPVKVDYTDDCWFGLSPNFCGVIK